MPCSVYVDPSSHLSTEELKKLLLKRQREDWSSRNQESIEESNERFRRERAEDRAIKEMERDKEKEINYCNDKTIADKIIEARRFLGILDEFFGYGVLPNPTEPMDAVGLLCERLKFLGEDRIKEVCDINQSLELSVWWENHKKSDQLRDRNSN